jgi:hypothetical protein
MLAYGVAGDLVDEYMRMSVLTCLKSMYIFCKGVVQVFAPQYLREPNEADTARLLAFNDASEFCGMLGSIGCMHWEWKNCPFAWRGQFKGHSEGATVIVEAVVLRMISRFGIPSLAWQKPTMISMCCNAHRFSLGL